MKKTQNLYSVNGKSTAVAKHVKQNHNIHFSEAKKKKTKGNK